MGGSQAPAGASRALQAPPGPSGCLEGVQTQASFQKFKRWVWGIPIRGKSMYIVYIWPTGVAGAVPPDVREERGGALDVHSIGSSHCLTQYGCIG